MICEQCGAEFTERQCECGWAGPAQRTSIKRPHDPDGISLEEFGQDLAEVIKTASALAWVTEMRKRTGEMALSGPDQTPSALRRREAELSKALAALTRRVSADDQRRISERVL